MKELRTVEAAYAKINLHLEVMAKRPDGYHELDSVMQTVSLADKVTIKVRHDQEGKMRLGCSISYIPTDERNIAWKVAKAFLAATDNEGDSLDIYIEKKIPVAAGLGGGSADGAAVLRALNRLYGYPLTIEALCELATSLGADIPFCIVGGCRRTEGIGEIFTVVPGLSEDVRLVIAMGKIGSNTARAYGKLDAKADRGCDKTALPMIEALTEGNATKVAERLFNRFEEVILPDNADASAARRIMKIAGAQGTLMSGSGAAVFGMFDDEKKAQTATAMLREKNFFAVTAKAINHIEK